jgi:hypothetical protein
MFTDKTQDEFSSDKTSVSFVAEINNAGYHKVICNENGCVIDFGAFLGLPFEFEGSRDYFKNSLLSVK